MLQFLHTESRPGAGGRSAAAIKHFAQLFFERLASLPRLVEVFLGQGESFDRPARDDRGIARRAREEGHFPEKVAGRQRDALEAGASFSPETSTTPEPMR